MSCCFRTKLTFTKDSGFTFKFGESGSGKEQGDYNKLLHKPTINEVVVEGVKEGADYSLQDLLVAGDGIVIEPNGDHTSTISAKGLTFDTEMSDDSENAVQNKVIKAYVDEHAGSSGALEAELVVSNPIGRYKMDEVLSEGTPFETIFRGLLSKTYYPTLTDPSLSLSYGANTPMKVGATVPSQRATLNFSRGSINPQYTAESPYRSGEATGYSVQLTGASISYQDSGTGNTFTIPAFTRTSAGNVVLSASVNYAKGVQPKDSDGADYMAPLAAGSKTASKTIEFILPFYWGKKAADSLTDLSGLTEDLSKKGNKTYTYTGADNDYLYIVYSAAYGNLKNIIDENGFDNIDSWIKQSLTVDGQNYTVYRSGFALTGNPPYTFRF